MIVFFFNDTATTEIYTLSLHDARPIFGSVHERAVEVEECGPEHRLLQAVLEEALDVPGVQLLDGGHVRELEVDGGDRKSTRLNSSHAHLSYAVFCLHKKDQPKS